MTLPLHLGGSTMRSNLSRHSWLNWNQVFLQPFLLENYFKRGSKDPKKPSLAFSLFLSFSSATLSCDFTQLYDMAAFIYFSISHWHQCDFTLLYDMADFLFEQQWLADVAMLLPFLFVHLIRWTCRAVRFVSDFQTVRRHTVLNSLVSLLANPAWLLVQDIYFG